MISLNAMLPFVLEGAYTPHSSRNCDLICGHIVQLLHMFRDIVQGAGWNILSSRSAFFSTLFLLLLNLPMIVFVRYFLFLLINVVFIFLLATTYWQLVRDLANSPAKVPEKLAEALQAGRARLVFKSLARGYLLTSQKAFLFVVRYSAR